MFYKKQGFPEDGELVICTVKKVSFHSVFVTLDEYKNLEGIIHISEVAAGRIRNIRDFVKEGKRLVCKVLRANKEKGQLDLSLRRVSVAAMKKKNEEYKQEQKAEKILEIVAQRLKIDLGKIYEEFGYKIIEEYSGLNACFQDIINKKTDLKELNIEDKKLNVLLDVIKEKIKPITVKIHTELILRNYAPNGIELIKETLKKTQEFAKQKKYDIELLYLSAPRYRISVTAPNYKTGMEMLREIANETLSHFKSLGGIGEIQSNVTYSKMSGM